MEFEHSQETTCRHAPPACPELNPQEPVWKAAREDVSHNHTRSKLSELAGAFDQHQTTTRFPCPLLEQHGSDEIIATFNGLVYQEKST